MVEENKLAITKISNLKLKNLSYVKTLEDKDIMIRNKE
jgi:hypothetical protein